MSNDVNIEDLMSSEEFDGLDELVKLGRKATPQLIDVLTNHSDPLMRKRAAIALGRIRDRTATEPLVKGLADKDPTVVLSAIEALGSLRVKKTSKEIIPLLKNPDPSIRLYAAKALGDLRPRDAKTPLEELLMEEELEFVRKAGADALQDIVG